MRKDYLVEFTDLLEWGECNNRASWNELCDELDDVFETVRYESSSYDFTEEEIEENEDEWLSPFAKKFLLDYMKNNNIKKFTLLQ